MPPPTPVFRFLTREHLMARHFHQCPLKSRSQLPPPIHTDASALSFNWRGLRYMRETMVGSKDMPGCIDSYQSKTIFGPLNELEQATKELVERMHNVDDSWDPTTSFISGPFFYYFIILLSGGRFLTGTPHCARACAAYLCAHTCVPTLCLHFYPTRLHTLIHVHVHIHIHIHKLYIPLCRQVYSKGKSFTMGNRRSFCLLYVTITTSLHLGTLKQWACWSKYRKRRLFEQPWLNSRLHQSAANKN